MIKNQDESGMASEIEKNKANRDLKGFESDNDGSLMEYEEFDE